MGFLQAMMVAALFVTGVGVALLGSVKVALARRLQIDEARVGGLVSLFGFAMIPVIFVVGFLTDSIGREWVMAGGSILFAGSLVVLGWARNYLTALAGVVLLSAAWSLLINVGNVLTPFAFPGPDPQSHAFAFNLACVFFGLGAFFTPLGLAWLLGRTSFFSALVWLGCLTLLPALLTLGVDFSELNPEPVAGEPPGLMTLLEDPVLWLCGLALFFYGPLEASMAAWATTYLGHQGVPEKTATHLLASFWLAFMASRLITALTLPTGAETPLIFILGLLCVGVFLAMVFNRGQDSAMILVAAAGFIFGPIFPTLIAVLTRHFDKVVHGRAVGLFFAIGGVGWTLIPILIGHYAKRTTVQRAFAIAVGAAVGLSGVALAMVLE